MVCSGWNALLWSLLEFRNNVKDECLIKFCISFNAVCVLHSPEAQFSAVSHVRVQSFLLLKLVEWFVCSFSHTSLFLSVSSSSPYTLIFFSNNLHIPFSVSLHLLYFIYLVDIYLCHYFFSQHVLVISPTRSVIPKLYLICLFLTLFNLIASPIPVKIFIFGTFFFFFV